MKYVDVKNKSVVNLKMGNKILKPGMILKKVEFESIDLKLIMNGYVEIFNETEEEDKKEIKKELKKKVKKEPKQGIL